MRVTLSAIKADIGSIAGHTRPSSAVLRTVEEHVKNDKERKFIDYYLGHCGDDIHILFTHDRGVGNEQIHGLAWDAFRAGTEAAKREGLYAAGQDLLKDAFSGNVRGLGPGVAETEIDERGSEPFVLFTMDKTEPGAFNWPFYLAFTDATYCPGLLLKPSIQKGFRFTIMDVDYTEGDRVVELASPEDIYKIATLLRDNNRFVIEAIHSRHTGEQVAALSTSRLHNIAGKYVGKDDPIALVRTQMDFPATEEVCTPFRIGHYVTGDARGSHTMPLMPVKRNSPASSYFCIPIVSAIGFNVKDGVLSEPHDMFNDPYWGTVRRRVAKKAEYMREQGWSGAAMAAKTELAYTAMEDTLRALDKEFRVR